MKSYKKNKRRRYIDYLKSIDTITTKLLTLVLFITIIPLMAIANFSTGLINDSMLNNAKNELNFNIKLSKEKYLDEVDKLKILATQTIKGYLSNSYNKYLVENDKKALIDDLSVLQNNPEINFCLILDQNGSIIASSKRPDIYQVGDMLFKFAKIAFSGETIASTEILTHKDLKYSSNNYDLFGLSQIVAVPITTSQKQVSAVLLMGKTLKNNNSLSDLIKRVTGATLSIYQINGLDSDIVSTNLPLLNNNKIERTKLPQDIINNINSGTSYFTREERSDGYKIGRYEPIRNYMGSIVGVMYIGVQENKFIELGHKNVKLIGIISVVSLLVAIGIAALFARTITNPILKLVSAAKYIASGDLNQRVKISGNDEIAQLAETFNLMADNLQTQEQLRDNFVATLTHDLKVPMLAENQTINYLLKTEYGPITDEQKDVLELIKSTNNSSLEMVSTLLEVYRYDTGNVQLLKTEFDIVKLAKESIEQINSLAEDKKIKIFLSSSTDQIMINGDEREIKRVLHNLISNAINNGIQRGHIYCNIELVSGKKVTYQPKLSIDKYTTLESPVDISNSVMVSIKDDGIGISREDMPDLFKRFSLNKGRKPAGTGLGLYYSHQVIVQHDGEIWAESSEGQGSLFIFKLPLENQEY